MNKLRKCLAMLVCMALTLTVVPCVTVWAAEGLEYYVYNDHVEITDYTGDASELEIPAEIEGLPVTAIGLSAFADCASLASVTIPDSVTSIESYSFYNCENLINVTIPDSVTAIGDKAFQRCGSLPSVKFPNSVTTIGKEAFYDCKSLTSVTIPNSVTTIGNSAFCNCVGLTSINVAQENPSYVDIDGVLFDKAVTELIQYPAGNNRTSYKIPNNVTTIYDKAFYGCKSLTSVTIPDSVTSIGEMAFENTGIYNDYSNWVDNFLYIGRHLIKARGYIDGNYVIKQGTLTIANCAFKSCTGPTSVTIPDSVTTIGYGAFYGCDNLTSVTIGDSVTTIGNSAFSWCESLTSVTIPNSVTTIGESAFYKCGSLTSVTIPNSVTTIGAAAFLDCMSLPSVTIPGSVTTIGESAFYNCTGLTSVTIGDGVNTIGAKTFRDCTSLPSVTIPNSVTSIGTSAFWGCSSLTNVTIPDSVTTIGDFAFRGCQSLPNVTIPNSVTTIGREAFYDCKSLTNMTISNKVTTIGSSSFYGCASLTNVTIPDSVTYIGFQAFRDCDSLTCMTIPNNVKTIDSYVFYSCDNLKSVTIGNNVRYIGDSVFKLCTGLTSVTIPNSVTYIKWNAFGGCDSLADVYYAGSEEDWTNIDFGGDNDPFLNATIHYNSIIPGGEETDKNVFDSLSYNDPEHCEGEFVFASETAVPQTEETVFWYSYDDNYFAKSAYIYNHDLARMSLRLAMSAFGVLGSGSSKYDKAWAYLYNLMISTGFNEFKYNDDYVKAPTTDSIGVAASYKKIKYPDGDYTLIAVGIRGAGYEREWGGDFRVGTGKIHEGFRLARDQVVEFLKGYISEKKIKGKLKIWITGYSRAAATTNLTAAYLDDNPDIFGGNVSLEPKDIYAYGFETPAGVQNPSKDELYNNIFSIINHNDFVPKVVMAAKNWEYDRYGVTKCLPTKMLMNPSDYKKLQSKMWSIYKKYCQEEYTKTKYDIEEFSYIEKHSFFLHSINFEQGMFLDDAINTLAKIMKDPDCYVERYESGMIYLAENLLGNGSISTFLDELINALKKRGVILAVEGGMMVYSKPLWVVASSATIDSAVKEAFEEVGIQYKSSTVELFVELFFGTDLLKLYSNKDRIAAGHFPELCLAWMDAIEEQNLLPGDVRIFQFNDDYGTSIQIFPFSANTQSIEQGSGIEVYDSKNNLVAAIYNGEVQPIEDGLPAYIDANGQAIIYLPVDEEYTTKITSGRDGQISYNIQEKNIGGGEVKITNYTVDVNEGEALTGTVGAAIDGDAEYTLVKDGGEALEPEKLTETETFTVDVTADGAGSISGGGSFHTGEWAGLTAVPMDGESFVGWYDGENLLTDEPVLRFAVNKDMEITAKFTDELCDVTFVSDGNVLAVQRVNKGETVDLSAVSPSYGCVIEGFYLDEGMRNPMKATYVFSGDATVYVKQVERTEPGISYIGAASHEGVLTLSIETEMIPDTADVYAAMYADDGQMIAAKKVTLENGSGELSVEAGECADVKVYIWDSEIKMSPLCKAAESKVIKL